MRKLMPMLALGFCLLISCEQQDENILPKQPAQDDEPIQSDLPHFDASNSTTMAWEDFPDELKNAIPLETKESESKDNARTMYSTYSYRVGPWGGWGGSPFYIYPPSGSQIYAIAIRAGGYIDRLTIWYKKSDGTIYIGGDRGGNGGTYYLQYFSSGEYIRYISGRSGGYVDRLSIYTNRKSFSYGGNGGSPFYVSVPYGYQILGFFGRSGGYIDQIGFYVYTL